MTIAAELIERRSREAREQAESELRRATMEYVDAVNACEDAAGHEAVADKAGPAGKSVDDVNADFRRRDVARRLQSLAANIDAAEQEYRNELMRVGAQQFVSDQRSRLARLEQIDSRNYRDECRVAAQQLRELADDAPEFFNVADGVPRLHGDDVAAQAADAAASRKLERLQSRVLRIDRELRTATAQLEKDANAFERCKWSAWKRELQRDQRQLQKQIESLDTADACDAGDAE